MTPVRVYEVGEKYGRLTVIERRERADQPVRCRCDCGNESAVKHAAGLAYGNTKSCGCLKDELTLARSRRHDMANTKLYNVWADMVGRATRPTHKRWNDYGGRGLTVCDRWRDFANFYADMGDCPPGRSLDRIDNDRGYSPENCRWATASEQAKNRRPFERKPRTHCQNRHGEQHEMTPDNVIVHSGCRLCRICHERRMARRQARKLARKATAAK